MLARKHVVLGEDALFLAAIEMDQDDILVDDLLDGPIAELLMPISPAVVKAKST